MMGVVGMLLIASWIAIPYVSCSCPNIVDGVSYDLNFGLLKGVESNDQSKISYYIDFCNPVPPNVDSSVAPCTSLANAYAMQVQSICTYIGQTPVVSALPNGAEGLLVNMTNYGCCQCGPQKDITRITVVKVMCGSDSTKNNFVVTEPDTCQYLTTITHPNACKKGGSSSSASGKHDAGDVDGLSPGSIFLIIFFVSAVVYVIAGFIVNWKVRGSSMGVEAIPNVELWRQVPGLVVDGLVFTKNKVLGLFGRGYTQL